MVTAMATEDRPLRRDLRRDRQHLQRVPPHDLTAEMALLGAALHAGNDVPAVVAAMEPKDFYSVPNQIVAAAVGQLVAGGVPVDTGTVSTSLREDGQLEAISGAWEGMTKRGEAYLAGLLADAYYFDAARAQRDADLIATLARKRQILALASQVVEGVYARMEIAGLAAQLQATIEETVAGQTSSWEPVNLTAILAGEGEEATPAILLRSDGQPLLYRGKIHAFNAEPEAGKGWLALWACLEVIARGGHVLYVDFEDDATTAVVRLLALGADTDEILERFHYVRPEEPVDVGATARVRGALAAWPIEMVVIDSVGEGMAMSDLDEKDGTDFRRFVAALPAVCRRAGAAVVLIDHLTKDPDKRGGYAIGTQAKKAALDVTLELQVVAPFGRDRDGSAKVWVRKDRHGHLRGVALDGRLLAEMHLLSRNHGETVSIELRPPGSTPLRQFRPTDLMTKISAELLRAGNPMSKTTIRAVVRGKNAYIDIALGLLLAEGYIAHSTKGYLHVRPFAGTAEDDPEQGQLVPGEDIADDF